MIQALQLLWLHIFDEAMPNDEDNKPIVLIILEIHLNGGISQLGTRWVDRNSLQIMETLMDNHKGILRCQDDLKEKWSHLLGDLQKGSLHDPYSNSTNILYFKSVHMLWKIEKFIIWK